MRSPRHSEQSVPGIPAVGQDLRPTAANVPAPTVGPSVSVSVTIPPGESGPHAPPRMHSPDRQKLLSPRTIDELLEVDHPARAVWAYTRSMDLTPLYDRIRARGTLAGRPAIDPRLLVALWLYATLAGVRSARALADLCVRHDSFRWLAGGVSVNAHTLADFRADHGAFLEGLLTHSVAVLRGQGLIDLSRIALDGMRVRASAGAASFRRRATLERLLQEAQAEVERLRQGPVAAAAGPLGGQGRTTEPASAEGPESSRQQQAATVRHAAERLGRIEQALDRLPEMEGKIKPGDPREARVSTTDPDATVMKMPDGGFRPAYNVQFGTTCTGQVVVGVDVLRTGSDQGQLPPMLEQIGERFGERPVEALVDGGYVKLEDIESLQGGEPGCKVYAPVGTPKKEGVDRHERKATDGEEVAEWRARMGTQEAKDIYKERAATAECVNAQARNRGLYQFVVRGIAKVKAIALWIAITHNMTRYFALQPEPILQPVPACA